MQNINFGDPSLLYGPGLGGLWAGRQQANNFQDEANQQAKTLEDIAAAQQKRQFEAEQQPLTLEKMRGENALYPGKLTELNQKNAASAQKLDRDKWNSFMEDLTNMDPKLMGPDRAAFFDNIAKKHNMDLDHPMVKIAARASTDPRQWQLLKDSTRISPEKQADLQLRGETTTATLGSHEKIAAGNNATQLEVARIQAQARVDAANARQKVNDIVSAVMAGKVPPSNAAVAFKVMAGQEQDPETRNYYLQMAQNMEQQALNEKNAQGKGGGVGVDNGQLTQRPPAQPTTTPLPAVNGPASSPNQVRTQQAPKTIQYQGKDFDVLGTNADGSLKIRDPQTGRTGTLRQ